MSFVRLEDVKKEFHSPAVSFRTMVSPETVGSKKLTMYHIVLESREETMKRHAHPDEEIYYILSGRAMITARGLVTDYDSDVDADTAIWIPSNAEHGLCNTGEGPLRYICFKCNAEPAHEKGTMTITRVEEVPQTRIMASIDRTFKILVPGQEVGAKGIVVLEIATIAGATPPHSHSTEEIYYVIRGQGIVSLNGKETEIFPGMAVYLPPNAKHNVRKTGQGLLQYVLCAASVE